MCLAVEASSPRTLFRFHQEAACSWSGTVVLVLVFGKVHNQQTDAAHAERQRAVESALLPQGGRAVLRDSKNAALRCCRRKITEPFTEDGGRTSGAVRHHLPDPPVPVRVESEHIRHMAPHSRRRQTPSPVGYVQTVEAEIGDESVKKASCRDRPILPV